MSIPAGPVLTHITHKHSQRVKIKASGSHARHMHLYATQVLCRTRDSQEGDTYTHIKTYLHRVLISFIRCAVGSCDSIQANRLSPC